MGQAAQHSLDLDEFVALLGLDVDESEVKWNFWVLHEHALDLAWVVVLTHLDEASGQWN